MVTKDLLSIELIIFWKCCLFSAYVLDEKKTCFVAQISREYEIIAATVYIHSRIENLNYTFLGRLF